MLSARSYNKTKRIPTLKRKTRETPGITILFLNPDHKHRSYTYIFLSWNQTDLNKNRYYTLARICGYMTISTLRRSSRWITRWKLSLIHTRNVDILQQVHVLVIISFRLFITWRYILVWLRYKIISIIYKNSNCWTWIWQIVPL